MGVTLRMKDLVPLKDNLGRFSGEQDAKGVFIQIVKVLEREGKISMDLEGVESLSPSFAYEAFGKLVDRFGPSIESKIYFENDPFRLSTRIKEAIERRKRVVEANARER